MECDRLKARVVELVPLTGEEQRLNVVVEEEKTKNVTFERMLAEADKEHLRVMTKASMESEQLRSDRCWLLEEGMKLVFGRARSCKEYAVVRDNLTHAIYATDFHQGVLSGYADSEKGVSQTHAQGYDELSKAEAEGAYTTYSSLVPPIFAQLAANPEMSVVEIQAMSSVVDPPTPS